MKVVELTNVVRRDTPLMYRRTYTATAVLAHGHSGNESTRIEFVLEHSPLGPVHVNVKLLEDMDCPVVPAIAALKQHIDELEQAGALP